MLRNNKGFSLLEAIAGISIMMVLVSTALPIRELILTEQYLLKARHMIQLALHDELLHVLYGDAPMTSYNKMIGSNHVGIIFTREEGLVKGCANWQNEKGSEEMLCLYGVEE